jgi:hypothetical protein
MARKPTELRKLKPEEPSLRAKLSTAFLEAFERDFAANGVAVIEALRNKSPDKYAEIAARLADYCGSHPRWQDELHLIATKQPRQRRLTSRSFGSEKRSYRHVHESPRLWDGYLNTVAYPNQAAVFSGSDEPTERRTFRRSRSMSRRTSPLSTSTRSRTFRPSASKKM